MARHPNHGGRRSNAGRARGVPNKASAEREKRIAATGVTPLEVMLHAMRDHFDRALSAKQRRTSQASMALALAAAKDAAPYVHPRRSAVTHTDAPMDLSNLTDRELDELERLIAKSSGTTPASTDAKGRGTGAGETHH
jgi:hypothetical protein